MKLKLWDHWMESIIMNVKWKNKKLIIIHLLCSRCGIIPRQAYFIVWLVHLLKKKKKKTDDWRKVCWWFGHSMWKNCCHFAKLQVLRSSAGTDCSCIHYCKTTYSWRDYLEAISKEVTLLWSRTHHIRAAGTKCRCRRVLDHWKRTGYWGSCDSAGRPCYMRWPGGSPYPALSCRNRGTKDTQV